MLLVFMYSKFDLSMYKMSCMRCWLPSNSLNTVIYQDLSSFQVQIELSHFPLMMWNSKIFTKEVFGKKLILSKKRIELN